MKKISRLLTLSFLLMTAAFAVSCSSDDDKYSSVSPKFSDITFTPSEIFPGERVTATAVQYKKGKLLNGTLYNWSISGTSEETNIENNKSLLYDNDKSNPICTFTAPSTPGTYTIVFKGEYNASGQSKTSGSTVDISGGTVEYSAGPFKCYVTVTKRFRVVNR